ncbi:MAG TPA: hypothetical protein VM802_14325 [Chitinophaga sp.]|uniref:hypothetical protein n=1 Tax=Chitinophaga sp. TaxID=1869181 RepID=UPI002CE3B708|nr:hypothetical protein [Chitinophaga sp.]HVI46048.1 hypothetical protein [Chitinophaga sp.]
MKRFICAGLAVVLFSCSKDKKDDATPSSTVNQKKIQGVWQSQSSVFVYYNADNKEIKRVVSGSATVKVNYSFVGDLVSTFNPLKGQLETGSFTVTDATTAKLTINIGQPVLAADVTAFTDSTMTWNYTLKPDSYPETQADGTVVLKTADHSTNTIVFKKLK